MEEKRLTATQKLFDERFKNLIGDLLTIVEAVVPDSPKDRQWLSTRKMLNEKLYEARDEFLVDFIK